MSPALIPTDRPPAYRGLHVDDDDAVRAVMTEVLGRKGFDVVAAASVTEALRLFTIQSFDVLITDLHNLSSLGFTALLPTVMTIADEVDAQLTQSMGSYMKTMQKAAAA